jgi:hypothetical protein
MPNPNSPSCLFNNVLQVFPVPAFVDDSSGAVSEIDRLQRMKDRITQMEKDCLVSLVSKLFYF